jgi:hypothetical protein
MTLAGDGFHLSVHRLIRWNRKNCLVGVEGIAPCPQGLGPGGPGAMAGGHTQPAHQRTQDLDRPMRALPQNGQPFSALIVEVRAAELDGDVQRMSPQLFSNRHPFVGEKQPRQPALKERLELFVANHEIAANRCAFCESEVDLHAGGFTHERR